MKGNEKEENRHSGEFGLSRDVTYSASNGAGKPRRHGRDLHAGALRNGDDTPVNNPGGDAGAITRLSLEEKP